MKLSVTEFLNKSAFPNRKIVGMVQSVGVFLIGFFLTVAQVHAQTQFAIPQRLEPIEFDQKLDLSSWNHYNRVEGLFAGGELTWALSSVHTGLVLGAGYSFAQKTPHYHLFGVKDFGQNLNLEVGGGYFDHVASSDQWTIGEIENSLSSLFLHEDFRDYYGLKGWQAWLQFSAKKWGAVRALVQSADYTSLRKNTDWALIPNHKTFRSNPAVAEGRETLLRLALVVDKMDNPIYPTQGIFFQGAFEKTLGGSAAIFQKYSALFSTLRLYLPTAGNQRLGALLRGARAWHAAYLPQHLVDLGGIGSLRGFRTKAFPDASALLFGRLIYFFGGDVFNSTVLRWIPISDMVELGVFAETGKRWFEEPNILCETSPCLPLWLTDRWHSDAGLSFSISGDLARIDLAHPVNETGSWRVTLRILPKW